MHVTPIWVSSSLVIPLIKNCVAFKSVKPILNDVSLIFVEQYPSWYTSVTEPQTLYLGQSQA